ncbi:hypothetical protein BGZ65_011917 [Modicella reniformis]|uniref:GH18 domain-containing protein n=1 Tax=Modicella reniformis TaxID=1440133 RepID=A0A9P6SUS1_9FUNG|nr:hypothetical protein BGZ65_011917 [Modicella reniformis]
MKFSAIIASLTLLAMVVEALRVVGYYGKTAGECPDYPSFEPAQLPFDLFTHLNFAFVLINDDGVVEMHHPKDKKLYEGLNDLKIKKPTLRTAITVGGWDMNMTYYSKMVSIQVNRQKFITSIMEFVRKYGFDGIDFDWEYSSDKLRGGHDSERCRVLKEMRDATNSEELKGDQERLILSIALPGGPFHGPYFIIPKLVQYDYSPGPLQSRAHSGACNGLIGKCMFMVVNHDQWVGYDPPEIFALKIEYLKKLGLGRVSIWSMDSDTANHELTTSIHKNLTSNFIEGEAVPGSGSEESVNELKIRIPRIQNILSDQCQASRRICPRCGRHRLLT